MGEGRFFSAQHRGQPVPGRDRQRVYSNHPEPVLTAWQAEDARFADSGWTSQVPPHPAPAQAFEPLPQDMPEPEFDPAPQAAPRRAAGPRRVRKAAPSTPPPEPRSAQTRTVLHGLAAVLSLALIVGTVGWMWQLMQRDVAGVPVVRALEGPARIAPENPGGRQAAHQGLSVNELPAASESAPRDTIMLAAPPVELAQDDLQPARLQEETVQPEAEFEAQPIPAALQRDVESTPLGLNNPTRRAVAASLRPQARDTRRMEESRVAAAAPAQSGRATDASPDDDALAASLAATVASGLGGVRSVDVDPASIGPGTRLVQLGAFDNEAAARAAWDQLANRFSPLLDDRGRVIEAAHSGGSVFFRLRAHGFEDERDARRFCSALVDQQVDCIPVLIR